MPTPAETRARAASLLSRIIVRKQTTDQVLNTAEPDPLLTELVYGSLRHYFSLSASVDQALQKPLRVKDMDIRCLMIVGLYQLRHLRVPDHAALHETVAATRHLGKPWAKGLVNAVLRRAPPPERSFEHPAWMVRMLNAAYGDEAPALMLANNERAPMALRVNLSRIEPNRYCQLLEEAGLSWRRPAPSSSATPSWGAETLILDHPVPMSRLPGYTDGLVSIQDGGAQLAAAVVARDLDPADTLRPADFKPRLLDACAAPGGKLFHLLERFPATTAVALDSSPTRMETMNREGRRLGHTHYVGITGDATAHSWWDGLPFDTLFLDAPCSGSGTLRRHPDIKVLRQAGDLVRYAALQTALLRSLWQVLRPGGTLVYCTCSLFPAENDDVVEAFVNGATDATIERFSLPTGRPMRMGWQLLPIDADTDGFYFARIRKDRA